MEKIDKIKKLKINKKTLIKYALCIGIGGGLGIGAVRTGLHINKDTNLPDFYYINTKDIDMSNQELLVEFNKVYNSRSDMRSCWGIIYPELADFILNNGYCLDQEQLLETLPNLKFQIVDDNSLGNDILASYKVYDNKILISRSILNESGSVQKEIMLHEAFHYLFFQGFNNSNILGSGVALDEGTASLLVHEYDSYAGIDDYTKNVLYVKMMCELVGGDRYLDMIGHHDLSQLKKYLARYSSNTDANHLINYIDKACNEDNLYDLNTIYDQKAFEIINTIYTNKYNTSIEESNDTIMKSYCNSLFETEFSLSGIDSKFNTIVVKNYFVDKKDITIVIFEDGELYDVVTMPKNKTLVK